MFEKILERILKKYLAPYIDGISRDGLSILKGDLSLQNLKIKAEAFDFLRPFGILLKSGKVARLHVQIPWRQLTQGKITIELESICVVVARIQGAVPDDATILWDNWQSKIAKVEKKVQELQELADNAGGDDNSGMVGRFMHRLAQNIQLAVGGGVMLQGFDTKQALSGGLLLEGLRVMSVGEAAPDEKVAALQKRVEITDIAAYVTVDDGTPRYMLEPTRLVLSVDHRASNLEAKLELLDRHGVGRSQKSASGCRLAVSHKALYRLVVTFREMGAWQSHTQEVIARHCQHVKTDTESLQGETYQQYAELYRRRQLGKEQGLTHEEEEALQAIEEAVMSRHLARWRLEVNEALKTREQTTRRGWRGLLGGGRGKGLVESGEWEQLQRRIRDDQAHLADLDRPRTVAVSLALQKICLQVYDDAAPADRLESITERTHEDQLEYRELVSELDAFDLGAVIQHDLRLELEQPQTSAKITPRVVKDYERSEWSFGLCFGTMTVGCDKDAVLRYISPDTKQVLGELEPHEFKDVAIRSRIQDDGTELVSANICLPPIQLCTSPQMLTVAMGIVTLDLPDVSTFGDVHTSAGESQAEAEARDWYSMHGTYWGEWEDEFSQWKREVVLETAEKQRERAKDSWLVFNVDVAVAAPQLTVVVSQQRRIHVDLGRIHLKSDGVMKADDFKAKLELSDTQVTCIAGRGQDGEDLRLPVLEPISLVVSVAGKKSEGEHPAGANALDVDLDVQLRRFKFDVYPQAVHLILEAPKAYLAALDMNENLSRRPSSTGAKASRHSGRYNTADLGRKARAGQETRKDTKAVASSAESTPSAYTVRAAAAIELISLGLFDLNLDQAARIDAADLRTKADALPSGAVAGSASLQQFLIGVRGRPLLQLHDSQRKGREALSVHFAKQADPPMTLALDVCPVQVEWRKEHVKALIAAAASCAAPAPPGTKHDHSRDSEVAEATLNQLSEVIEAKVRERRRSSLSSSQRTAAPQQRTSTTVGADDASRQVARQGLVAGGELPPLAAEEQQAAVPAMVVDVKFGGLLIKLFREEHERVNVLPAWRAKNGGALIEWHVVDLTAKYETFPDSEARCRVALDSFSILYDGHCIIAPWSSGTNFFEADLRIYRPVQQGGPLHSVCFRGMLRKLSIVFFLKHIDSLVSYLTSNIVGALVQQAAEAGKEAMEKPKTAESVALWNVFVESPVIYLARDEQMLRYSPAWDHEAEMLAPGMAKASGNEEGEASDGDFEDAMEHPTPMVEELQQYILMYPGSIQARNTFEADGTESPPSLFRIGFSQTNLDAVDRVGPASGNILKVDNWELMLRLDSPTAEQPMHVSVGLDFQPIGLFLTPERLRVVLDCLQENISYKGYFPQPPMQAPEGSRVTAGPSFAGGQGEDLRVQSMSVNVRISFGGLNVTLSRLASGSLEGKQPVYEPLLGLAIGTMRLLVDTVFYYDNVPMAMQLGVFLNSVSADDRRPAEARASILSTRLLELGAAGGFSNADGVDSWVLLPNREQGKQPYLPGNAALLLVFAIASASASSLRFELRRPRIFALLRLAADAGAALGGAYASSSMAAYPGPPVPTPDGLPLPAPAPVDKNLSVCLSVQEASLSMYTSYVRAAAPVVKVILSLSTKLGVGATGMNIEDVSLSDLLVSRTEVQEAETAGGKQSGKASASSVQLFTLGSLQVAGEQRKAPRPELDLKVCARPASVRLTTGDVPHLVAALSGLGGDKRAEDGAEQQEAQEELPDAEAGAAAELAAEPSRGSRVGVLRLLVRGLPGAPSLDSLHVTACFGDQRKPVAMRWGRPLLLSVPPVRRGFGGAHKRVADGPMLQLALHGPGPEGGIECLATMVLPAELCAGRGLDGRRLLRAAGPFSEAAARALGTPPVAGRRLLELDLQARYEPSSGDNAVALGIAGLCAAAESFDEFVKPCELLEDFLQEGVPRLGQQPAKRKSARASTAFAVRRQSQRRESYGHAVTKSTSGPPASAPAPAPRAKAAPPLAVRIVVAIEGFDASFLDDCQAHVLPVLRLCLRAGSGRQAAGGQAAGRRPGPAAGQVASDRASMIKFEMNPWGHSSQRLGLSLGVENYYIGVSYLNARAGCWEPFLEPWAVDFFYSAFPNMEHGGSAKATSNPMLRATYQAANEITLMSFGPLNVNVTPQLCSLASFLLSNKEAYVRRLKSPSTAVEGAGGARYRLLNMASAPVCLAVIQPGPAQDSAQELGSVLEPLDWRIFEPCSAEVPLDPLLGHRSAEEWRLMADETLACLVGLLPPSGLGGGAPRDPLRVLLSSTCDGLIAVPSAREHAACEVLLPHPSHHLMLISGRLRVFNHTSEALEVRFQSLGAAPLAGAQLPNAAPMHVLPERLAFPPEIAAGLRSGTGSEGDAEASMAPVRTQESSQFGADVGQTGPVPDVPDAQRLPSQYFCSAPLWATGADTLLQLRLAGASAWSEPVPLDAGSEDAAGKALLVPGTEGALLRLHSYRSRGASPSVGGCCTALHICAPLRLLNATPVRLCFSFSSEGSSEKPMRVEVDAFSECDVSSELDPAQPFSLSLALADASVDASVPGASAASSGSWAESPTVQRIFDNSQPQEELVPVPLARGDADAGLALGVTVSRGLAVRASCSRWLVDRTGLGLRALCAAPNEVPSADAAPLAQADGLITLLDNVLSQAAARSTKKAQPDAKYYLAVPGGKGSWSALSPAKLPDEESGFVRVALAVAASASRSSQGTDVGGYPFHVCLQSEAASSKLTFGAHCQVISVLPQVVIYNQLADDALVVRAVGDPSTEVSVPAGHSGGFLRWPGEADASAGRSPLAVQFRPAKLAESCGWSMSIGFGVGEASGPMALLLPPADAQQSRSRSCALDMFTAEVAERAGVVCLTVKRGSRCELQNFSCLVESVALRPAQGRQPSEAGEAEEFSARSCETVALAWSTAGTESQLEVALTWGRAAGGSCSRGAAPDLRKPGHVVFPAPDGWQAVLVETGSTGGVCWMRVQDVIWTTMSDSECFRVKAKGPAPAQLKAVVSIAHVGLSLVSPKREQELLYAEIRNVAALLGRWESSVCLDFTVTNLQVDCQLLDFKDCPAVFANRAEPALQCKVIQQLPPSSSGVGLDILGVSVNALELSINEGFLAEVGEAVTAMLRPILRLEELGRERIEAWRREPLGGDFEVPPPTPLQIDISQFTFLGLEVHLWASMRLSKLPAVLRGALGVLTVGSDRLSIQGATLQLDPEVFDNIYGPAPTVARMILQRYWGNLLISLASLLGRSTLLELPSLPVKWGRRGVESGMCAINFLLTRTANVFEHCTLDKQYVRQKRPLLGQQIMEVTSLKTGVGAAGQHLAEGVMHVGDIVREPLEGARDGGLKGFATGFGRGVMGTVVQPVLGAVYGVRSLSRGVLIAVRGEEGEATSQRKVGERRRPPRVMYAAGAIQEYVEAQPAGAEQYAAT